MKLKHGNIRLLAILFAVTLALTASLFVGCKPQEEGISFPTQAHAKTGLAEHDLTIEWLDAEGNPATLTPRRPIAIIFHGQTDYNAKEDATLSETDYFVGESGTLEYATTNRSLAYYWNKMGYNLGIFHYENFVDYSETAEEMLDKVYTRSAAYRDDKGNLVNRDLPELSLLDVFWNELVSFLKESNPVPISERRGMEVRLIGNGIGANIALAAADYCYVRNEAEQTLSPAFLPVRTTLINPVYSESAHEFEPVWREGEKFRSVSAALEAGAMFAESKGVVLEFVEENPPTEPTDEYNRMIARGVHLTFSQSFSERFNAEYAAKKRAALDWYLLSMGGSDYSGLSSYNIGIENTRPMFDTIDDYSNSMVRYSLSAWTPTAYIRALKGRKMKMQRKEYNSSTGLREFKPYVMNKLAAENYQCSDLSNVLVAGYIYVEDAEASEYINFGERLAGVEVRLFIYQSTQSHPYKEYRTVSGADGFYTIAIDRQYFATDKTNTYTFNIEVVSPSVSYGLIKRDPKGSDQLKLEKGTLLPESNQISPSVSGSNTQIIIRNGGLHKYE